MKKFFLTVAFAVSCYAMAMAQVSINADSTAADPSAMLDVKSSQKGMLVPRMTMAERDAISNPATGLLIFCTDNNHFYTNKGTPGTHNWVMISSQWVSNGSDIYFSGGNIGLGLTNPGYPIDVAGDINYSGMLRKNGIPVVTGVSGVTATLPLLSSGGDHPDISVPQATSLADGFLSHTDWGLFNAKQNVLTFGNLTSSDLTITGGTSAVVGSGTTLTFKKGNLAESTSSVLIITNGNSSVLGTGTTIRVRQANTTQSGYLSNTDWNTFNNKQSALTFGNLTSADINVTGGTSAVQGTGASLAINKGNLTSSDISVIGGSGSVLGSGTALTINKGNLTEVNSSVLNITSGTNAVLGTGGATIEVKQATFEQSGYLDAGDYNYFTGKQDQLSFGNLAETGSSVLTITGGSHAVVGSGASIQVKQANTDQSGFLGSADWDSFNNKVSSQWASNGLKLHYTAGNVGIGTTNPQNKIDIAGNAVIGSTYSGANAAPENGLLVEGKVGVGTTAPATSAAFEVNSNNHGVLLPVMTLDQRNAIAGPVEGLLVFCLDCSSNGTLSVYSNDAWHIFTLCNAPPSAQGTNIVSPGQIIWNWTTVTGATGYKWNITSNYGTAIDMGTATSKTETGITCGSTNTRYVWAYRACGVSEPATLTQTISATPPAIPTEGTHVPTKISIVWNWNTVADAIGYKWSATNDFGTATNMGTATTKSESGLTCETAYTRYVWAYNNCGNSAPVTLTQMTLYCWACGDPGTINHVQGTVAPVTKTVTYGTVTNIPGEPTKCWITSNLGADHQATAANDATEPSAGWYWQFNRKQGYQYTTSRTPNTTWITGISEITGWTAENDPCTLLLGSGWRIPFNTEWSNVDASGGWTNLAGPWNSALKLHAAGSLYHNDGSLVSRGLEGTYWSQNAYNATTGWELDINNAWSITGFTDKSNGFSLRCIRDQ